MEEEAGEVRRRRAKDSVTALEIHVARSALLARSRRHPPYYLRATEPAPSRSHPQK